jgi:uncharacterized protein (TIGR00369 family)
LDISKAIGRRIPFASLLGLQLHEHAGGRARVSVELRAELMNSFEAAHGGVVMTLLDVAMAMAARSMDAEAVGAITIEMKTSFIGAGSGTLSAEGRCLHLGKSVAFCEGTAHDAAGKLVASASGTFMLRHPAKRKASA